MREDLSTLLNLSKSLGVDPAPEESAARNGVAPPPIEALSTLYGNGCIFASAADERVTAHSAAPRRHWM